MPLRWLTIVLMGAGLLGGCAQADPTATPPPSATPTPAPTPIPPPVASFAADVSSGGAPFAVQFSDTSQGAVTAWRWDFGDGTTSAERNPTHEYTAAGSHSVGLTVSGPGGTDIAAPRDPIVVSPGPLRRFTVSPGQVTVSVQEAVHLTTTASDRFDNEISDAVFGWSSLGTAGSIDATGRFAAGTSAGTYGSLVRVTATQGPVTLEALVDVTVTPGPLSAVAVQPASVDLEIGAAQSFTFEATDEFGNEIADALASWSGAPEAGTLDSDGVLTAGAVAATFPAAVRVNVVKGLARVSATADVAVRPGPLARVAVQPSSAIDLEKGSTTRFTAAGFDRFGNEIPGLAFLWEATGGEIDPTGLFEATGLAGRYEVTASATYRGSQRSVSAAVDWFPSEWRQLIAAAQEEGELVTFMCCGTGQSISALIPQFEAEFGIKWTNITGSSSQRWESVRAERAAGIYRLDVWAGGLGTSINELLPAGALQPLKPLLFHPDVIDESLWFEGDHFWGDAETQQYLFGFGSTGTSGIAYNTDLIFPERIQSYEDLLDPQFEGLIVAIDPRTDAADAPTLAFYSALMGEDFLARLLTEMDITFVEEPEQAAELLAQGEFALCLFGCEAEVRRLKGEGLPVESDLPHSLTEGGRLAPGGTLLFAMDNAPHPNAQRLFVNWWLSREGQLRYQNLSGEQSLRTDIPTDGVAPRNLREDGKRYILLERDPDYQRRLEDAVTLANIVLTFGPAVPQEISWEPLFGPCRAPCVIVNTLSVEDGKFEFRLGEAPMNPDGLFGYPQGARISSQTPGGIVIGPMEVGTTFRFNVIRMSGGRSSKDHYFIMEDLGIRFEFSLDGNRTVQPWEYTFTEVGEFAITSADADGDDPPGEHGMAVFIIVPKS